MLSLSYKHTVLNDVNDTNLFFRRALTIESQKWQIMDLNPQKMEEDPNILVLLLDHSTAAILRFCYCLG